MISIFPNNKKSFLTVGRNNFGNKIPFLRAWRDFQDSRFFLCVSFSGEIPEPRELRGNLKQNNPVILMSAKLIGLKNSAVVCFSAHNDPYINSDHKSSWFQEVCEDYAISYISHNNEKKSQDLINWWRQDQRSPLNSGLFMAESWVWIS